MSDAARQKRNPSSAPARAGSACSFVFFCCLAAGLWAAEPVSFEVKGLEGKPLENVRAALSLPPGIVRDGKVDKVWLERLAGRWEEEARRSLEPFGYYDAAVRTELSSTEEGRYHVLVTVEPGEPVRVTEVRVRLEGEGASSEPLHRLAEEFPLRPGDALRHDEYEGYKGALLARTQDLGYLDADFPTHELRVNREARSAEIDLALDTGPRYYFDEVEIRGAGGYPDRFLRRYLAFRPGDVFSYAKLGETQVNFRNSDRFKEIVLAPEKDGAVENRVPVSVALTPSAPKRLRPGIGYGTDTGPRFTVRYKDVNAFRRGHEFDADLYLSEVRQTLGAKYTVPAVGNLNSETSLKTGIEREDTGIYVTRSAFAEIERLRVFRRGRTGSLYLRTVYEDFTIAGGNDEAFLVLPGARFSRRRFRGSAARPGQGYGYALELRGTHEALGSDISLVQLLASGNALVRLPARFSILLRLNTAYTENKDPLDSVPVSLRFFAGGDQSVRGYAYQSLGPTGGNGEVVGGRNLLVGSVEIERAIRENWAVAAFYDAGNAFNSASNLRLFQGAGIGIRYYTLVGPLRVDLARQIGVPDPSYRLHVGLGFAL